MNQVFGFFTSNYTWMLGIIITILLAIIGSYAEKTNFGQGKLPDDTPEDEEPDEELMENFKIQEAAQRSAKNDASVQQPQNGGYAPNYDSKFDYNYDKMSNEVEKFLPKKSVIDSDLLDEIDGLSLDKTQKFKFDDSFGLDDLELPEIKGLESDDDEDIWKF